MDNNLLAKGGALVIDNALFKGSVYLEPQERDKNGHAVAEFNEYVRNDQRTEQVHTRIRWFPVSPSAAIVFIICILHPLLFHALCAYAPQGVGASSALGSKKRAKGKF